MDIATRARTLLDLHHTGTTLVLPNVWDAWSARAVAEAGFPALSIGSHPLADSRGQGDNEDMTLDDALDGVRRICSAVPDVPVTADLESGYDTPAAELVERMLEAGAVGLNIEDTVHSQGRMREPAEHADYIGAIRLLFRSALRRLELAERRKFRPGFTNRELLRRYRSSPLADSLARLVETIELKWYGNTPCEQADYVACRGAHDDICQHVRDAGPALRP